MQRQGVQVGASNHQGSLAALSMSFGRPWFPRYGIRVLLLLASLPGMFQCQLAAQQEELLFLEGLRQRAFHDTALEYLDELAAKPDLSPSIREILDLERGITLKQMGSAARVPEDRDQRLNEAAVNLRKFAEQHADHPQAAFANSSLGELLFDRARTLTWKADAPGSESEKPELQQQARQLIDEAEVIFQKAHDLYLALYKKYPTYVDQATDPESFQARLDVESRYLRAWYNLCRCMYERGQTYDPGSEARRETLTKAYSLFEAIHTSRRTNFVGLSAQLMMGKCFQEQGDLGRALGLYNSMLANDSDHPDVQVLKSIALHYRLICLNDPQRNDHQQVLQEATQWISENRSLVGTADGLGILWEKAIAEEKLSEDRSLDAQTKQVLQRQALADSQQVARTAGPYREPANAMSRRLKVTLGDTEKEPRDFDTAFERARGMIDQIQKLKDDVEAAVDESDRQQKITAMDLHLNEVGRLLKLALDLRTDDTDAKAAAQARYLLSFILFRQRKNFDAVVLATYSMVKDRAADPDTALNATEIAITAAVQAWNDAAGGDREFETQLLRDVCVQVLQLYPQSARGNEARIRLGRVYQQLQQPLEAARWFLEVPESDPQYASARISAGQAFWTAWSMQTTADELADPSNRRSADELRKTSSEAKTLLLQGIQLSRERLGAEAAQPDEVIAAEVSLASILNMEGDFVQAIQRLTAGGDNSVVKTLEVSESETRPESGIRSAPFVSLTWRLLLRAYVGTQQIDEALQTMSQLEKVGGQDVTAVYTQLGMELQEELKRLKQTNDAARLAEVRQSFEKFLARVFEKRDQNNYNSLLWIGETYFGLGQGVADDPAAASDYYARAAEAYNTVIQNRLAQEPTLTAIRLRLARCRRQQQLFDDALQICTEILKSNPLALDAQFEAALTLGDWGATGTPSKLLDSIQGVKDDQGDSLVWGWANIAKRLQQSVQKAASPEMKDRFLESRLQLSNSRRRYAATGAADGETQLRAAMAEITIFTQVYRDIDATWWSKFDRLYQDLQADLGKSPAPLERPAVIVAATAPAKVTSDSAASTNATAVSSGTAAQTAPASGSPWLMTVLVLGIAAVATAGFYVLLSRPQNRRKAVYSHLGAPGVGGAGDLQFAGFVGDSGTNAGRRAAVRDSAKVRDSAALPVASSGKPAVRLKPGEGGSAPVPRTTDAVSRPRVRSTESVKASDAPAATRDVKSPVQSQPATPKPADRTARSPSEVPAAGVGKSGTDDRNAVPGKPTDGTRPATRRPTAGDDVRRGAAGTGKPPGSEGEESSSGKPVSRPSAGKSSADGSRPPATGADSSERPDAGTVRPKKPRPPASEDAS